MTTNGRPKALTTEQVLQHLNESPLPFLTSTLIAQEHDCSTATARNRLNELVEGDELKQYDLGQKRTLYFRPDYDAAEKVARALSQHLDLTGIDRDDVEAFASKPYQMIPRGDNEYYVVTPRFVPFELGHLHQQDDAWQTFIINKYTAWINDLPSEIRERTNIEQRYDDLTVRDYHIDLDNPDDQNPLSEDLSREGIDLQTQGDDIIQFDPSSRFDVIAALIDRGHLPFSRQPVQDDDLRATSTHISLREYQDRAWTRFRETGQIGVYWPPSAGKTYLSLYAGDRLSGRKLVVVPSTTLEQQWEDRINEDTTNPSEWDVHTYDYLTSNGNITAYQDNQAPLLTVYDECHTLPADTYSMLATLDTKYRIGLSASPYREDRREDYIVALTGHPVGMNWEELVELDIISYPTVWLYLYHDKEQKKQDLVDLANTKTGNGIIFCDRLDEGQELADKLGVPFVNGNTDKRNRVDLVQKNRVAVISRVGDEGLSLGTLDWAIEYAFHGNSCRQEIQRVGRVMHSSGETHHIIQMTDEERNLYGDRLLALEQKGMRVRPERRDT